MTSSQVTQINDKILVVKTFLDDMFEYYQSNVNRQIDDIIISLPKKSNLSTGAKITYLEELKNKKIQKNEEPSLNIKEFADFLNKMTHGKDFINFHFLIKFYNLNLDDNGMIIFTDEFRYSSIKEEALYIWWIINSIKTHSMFSKYPDLLSYCFQNKLENGILPSARNFKYDLIFNKLGIALEVDESHHDEIAKQRDNDLVKKSLCRLHGTLIQSLKADNVINKSAFYHYIKLDVSYDENAHNDLCSDIKNDMLAYLAGRFIEVDIYDSRILKFIRYFLYKLAKMTSPDNGALKNYIVRKSELKAVLQDEYNTYIPKRTPKQQLKISLRKICKIKEKTFNSAEYLDKLFEEIQSEFLKICKSHVKLLEIKLLDKHCIKYCKNSKYLDQFKTQFFNILLCSMINDFDFRQDYITKIFLVNLVNSQKEKIKRYKSDTHNYNNIESDYAYEFISDLNNVLQKFSNNNSEFISLFKFKSESLINVHSPNIIKLASIIEIIKIDEADVKTLHSFVKTLFNIDTTLSDEDILLSWEDISSILTKFRGVSSEMRDVLLFYYQQLDRLYENIISRIVYFSNEIKPTSSDFYTYMNRVVEHFTSKSITFDIFDRRPYLPIKNSFDSSDYTKLSISNITQQILQLSHQFESIRKEHNIKSTGLQSPAYSSCDDIDNQDGQKQDSEEFDSDIE